MQWKPIAEITEEDLAQRDDSRLMLWNSCNGPHLVGWHEPTHEKPRDIIDEGVWEKFLVIPDPYAMELARLHSDVVQAAKMAPAIKSWNEAYRASAARRTSRVNEAECRIPDRKCSKYQG